ncbi:hypothetical protein VB773_10635 [Haloarculaceae archaeon H-GB2-1]|nr:hypothetical protein [Haloarculaceae archaeon H-GB11]MEA5407968.1 hypothetical protein [Haloarculaceae archaeon H-GB2-1]
MDATRLAPTVGIAACLAVLGVLALPISSSTLEVRSARTTEQAA